MSQPIISVENLSKKFNVGLKAVKQERYVALRDVVARNIGGLVRHPLASLRGLLSPESAQEEFWALKDVSFDVHQGQVLGIVGRNGAGKSTLLKILSRITEPSEGRVVMRGRVASLLEVGTGFHPELTGRENIYLNGAMLGMGHAEITRKFDEIVAFSEVEKFLDTPVKRYSSGMYVRLAFAVAAHLEPQILVVDEVLAVGDAEFQKKCLGKMHDVASKEGRTVLFVSHNLAAIENLCDSAILLADGRLRAKGGNQAIVQEYIRSIRQSGPSPLSTRIDREGSGMLRVVSIGLENIGGDGIPAVQCGAAAILRFKLENLARQPFASCTFSVGIDNEWGQRVALIDSEMIGYQGSVRAERAQDVRVTIPHIPLIPGRYHLTVYISVNGIIADWIKQAFAFDVETGDYYGTGRLPPDGQGFFLLDHTMEYSDADYAPAINDNPGLS